MLTKEQKVTFAQMLFNDKDLLFGDCGPNLSKVEKQEKWIEIFIKLNAMGANIPSYQVRLIFKPYLVHFKLKYISIAFCILPLLFKRSTIQTLI